MATSPVEPHAIITTSIAEWRDDLRTNPYWSDKPTGVASMSAVLNVVESVLKLHAEREFTNEYMAPYTQKVCAECRQVWPCATVRAMGMEF